MNKKLIAVFALIALFIIFLSFGARGLAMKRNAELVSRIDSENMNMLYENAKSFYLSGDYDKAAKFFKEITHRYPESEVAKESLLNLADSCRAKGDYPEAKDALMEYVRKFPDSENSAKIKKDIENLNMEILFSDIITDDSFRYEIKPGDTLAKIASRFGITVELLRRSNGLKTDLILPGKFLKVNKTKFKIFVDKSENILILKKSAGENIKTYVVSTGENLGTPTGTFKIEEKLVSPVWFKLGAIVKPDSAEYELGTRWLGLSIRGYGIHGTNDATSIGKHITKGCIRMRNDEVEELYAIVPSGTEVTIVE